MYSDSGCRYSPRVILQSQTVISGIISGPAYFAISTMEVATAFGSIAVCPRALGSGVASSSSCRVGRESQSGSAVLVYRGRQCSCFQLLSSSGLTCVMSTLDELLVKAATRRAVFSFRYF